MPKELRVTFVLTIEDDDADEVIVEEAVTMLVDEEIRSHRMDGSTRCGLTFVDALEFEVEKL